MKCVTATLAVSIATMLAASAAAAETLTFDDLPNERHQGTVPDGYGGLDWSNFYVVNGLDNDYNPSGYRPGTISRSNVIFDGHGRAASFSSVNLFTLSSVYLTAAWRNGLTVTLTGERNGVVEEVKSYTVSSTSPSFVSPDFVGVNDVVVSTSGGTHNPVYPYADNGQVAIDNLSLSFAGYAPGNPIEPTTKNRSVETFSGVPVVAGLPFYFDPTAAPAYTFVNKGGPAFSAFEVPFSDSDGLYDLSTYDTATGKYVFDEQIKAGQWVQLSGDIGNFQVSGISGYDGPVTFGLKFASAGDADFTQTALAAVPLPAAAPLFAAGLVILGAATRRRQKPKCPLATRSRPIG